MKKKTSVLSCIVQWSSDIASLRGQGKSVCYISKSTIKELNMSSGACLLSKKMVYPRVLYAKSTVIAYHYGRSMWLGCVCNICLVEVLNYTDCCIKGWRKG